MAPRLVRTAFDWPTGPAAVQVTGDWDGWKERVELTKAQDGSFSKQLELPEETKIHYKFIVDGVWQTKVGLPTEKDAANNENNVLTTATATKSAATAAAISAAPNTADSAAKASHTSSSNGDAPGAATVQRQEAAKEVDRPSTATTTEVPENSVPNTPSLPFRTEDAEDPLDSIASKTPGGLTATAAGGIAGASAGTAGIAALFGGDKSSLRGSRPTSAAHSDSKTDGAATPVARPTVVASNGAVPASQQLPPTQASPARSGQAPAVDGVSTTAPSAAQNQSATGTALAPPKTPSKDKTGNSSKTPDASGSEKRTSKLFGTLKRKSGIQPSTSPPPNGASPADVPQTSSKQGSVPNTPQKQQQPASAHSTPQRDGGEVGGANAKPRERKKSLFGKLKTSLSPNK